MITPVLKHPAKFSEPILEKIAEMIDDYGWPERILDPFAGIGRVHQLTAAATFGVEIEPEWAAVHPRRNTVANALHLPFADNTFDGLVSSPCYGNRFSDHHMARDKSERRSYSHDMRAATGDPSRLLHRDNAGTMRWGDDYRSFHDRARTECLRTLKPGALVVINVSNFYRLVAGEDQEQLVTEWHFSWFMRNHCDVLDFDCVTTQRMRKGANREKRVAHENVFALRYSPPEVLL
jgi:SAM-dependent methyltransferase